jgi:hypothetical protein
MTLVKLLPGAAQVVREGDVFLLLSPGHWGKGETLVNAKGALLRAGGSVRGGWALYSAHPDTYVRDDGYMMAPKGHGPVLIEQHGG